MTTHEAWFHKAKEELWNRTGFLKPGWWLVHFIGISLVYFLGHVFWR